MANFSFHTAISPKQTGFTLVELMVVVVILAIFAGMLTLSVATGDNRKNLALYEHLQSNLGYIRLLASEDMRPYGLAIRLADGDNPNQLVVVRFARPSSPTNESANADANAQPTNASPMSDTSNQSVDRTAPSWELAPQIPPLDVPDNVKVSIEPLDTMSEQLNRSPPAWLTGEQAPPLVWFGTGEATPVRITLHKINPNDVHPYAIGDAIVINSSGALEVEP